MTQNFDVLSNFYPLWDYILVLARCKDVPNHLRYSIGEMIVKEMAEIGADLYIANKTQNQYQRRKLAVEASMLYDKTKFKLRLFVHDPSLKNRSEILYALESKFGKCLGGWLESMNPSHGAR
ncbi:MAG: hypothetical protein WCS71_06625 [Sphaerochaetaceae bacterium]|jgi:hypothetical protein